MGATLLEFEFLSYVEMVVGYGVGFFAQSSDSDPLLFSNCTYQTQMLLVLIQFGDLHARAGRWEPLINEVYNLLLQVDPVAKACMPIYVTVFLLSDYYGPSFQSSNRVLMNTMYRLGDIYTNSAEINRKIYNFLRSQTETGEEKNI